MAYQILELTLISASDFKKVTFFSRMRVDAVASISGGDSRMPTRGTQVDRDGGQNQVWNSLLHFPIPANVDTRGLALDVLLRSEASFFSHRDVGEVFVSLNDLLARATDNSEPKIVSYQVHRPLSGRAHGVLYFSYKFRYVKDDVVAAVNTAETKEGQYINYAQDSERAMLSATAYPEQQAALVYPMHVHYGAPYVPYTPQPYGYAPQLPYRYNAAPPPVIYGYMALPMTALARQRRGMEMGLGLGILSGTVGGMMLGDMIGHFEADAAYDAGFHDGLGF